MPNFWFIAFGVLMLLWMLALLGNIRSEVGGKFDWALGWVPFLAVLCLFAGLHGWRI